MMLMEEKEVKRCSKEMENLTWVLRKFQLGRSMSDKMPQDKQ